MADIKIDDTVDITDVVCPVTFVKAKVGMIPLFTRICFFAVTGLQSLKRKKQYIPVVPWSFLYEQVMK